MTYCAWFMHGKCKHFQLTTVKYVSKSTAAWNELICMYNSPLMDEPVLNDNGKAHCGT